MSFAKYLTIALPINVVLIMSVSRILNVTAASKTGVEASWTPTLMTGLGAFLSSAVVLGFVWASAYQNRKL